MIMFNTEILSLCQAWYLLWFVMFYSSWLFGVGIAAGNKRLTFVCSSFFWNPSCRQQPRCPSTVVSHMISPYQSSSRKSGSVENSHIQTVSTGCVCVLCLIKCGDSVLTLFTMLLIGGRDAFCDTAVHSEIAWHPNRVTGVSTSSRSPCREAPLPVQSQPRCPD